MSFSKWYCGRALLQKDKLHLTLTKSQLDEEFSFFLSK